MFHEYDPYERLRLLEEKLDHAYDSLKELARINHELAEFANEAAPRLHLLEHKTEYLNQRLQRLEKEIHDGKTKTRTTTRSVRTQ